MKSSDTFAQLYGALAEAQGAFEAAVKDSTNPAFRTNYADLASHVDAARPHLRANGLAVIQDVTSTINGIDVTTRLLHKSGEWLEFGPLFIPASKYDAQGLGSAISYGRRYALSAALGTVADDDDGNAAVKTAPGPRPAAAPPPLPEHVIDTATGEEVPVGEKGLPEAPAGYHYVTGYKLAGAWHEATILNWDAQGGALKVSTKNKIGEALKNAEGAKLPVKVNVSEKNGYPGEAYLDRIAIWAPPKAKPAPKAVPPPPPPPPPAPSGAFQAPAPPAAGALPVDDPAAAWPAEFTDKDIPF